MREREHARARTLQSGPYLILREPREAPVAKSSLDWVGRTVLESRPFAVFVAVYALLFLVGVRIIYTADGCVAISNRANMCVTDHLEYKEPG